MQDLFTRPVQVLCESRALMPKVITKIEPQATKLKYRPDIDGLRALAVILVVLDHLKVRLFAGGYIGVDVFFVISGYLISSVILNDLLAGKFSVVGFYERRVRRIFPALLFMLLFTSVVVGVFYLPIEVEAFAGSLLAALFSVSNFYFWHQSGYFDALGSLKPLVHTWSLAVEEQFYIFFPLFLVAVRRWFPDKIKQAVLIVTIVTFVMACFWVQRDPTATFYFAPLRAWELLIGTIISQRYLPSITGRVGRNLASTVGMLLVIVSAISYTDNTTFPGLAALPPCIGAALIIAAGETGPSICGNILALRPVVFIGLISYSLYLWHWPILVFNGRNTLFLNGLFGERIAKVVLISASIIAATLSWALIETPFRKGRLRPGRRTLFLVTGAAVGIIALIGISMIGLRGLPARFPREALQVSAYTNYDPAPAFRQGVCFLVPENTFADFRPSVCLRDDSNRKQYLLLGDSLGAQLYAGLSTVFTEINISQATSASCLPFVTTPSVPKMYASNCGNVSRYIYGDYLVHHPDFDLALPDVLALSLRERSPEVIERHLGPANWQLDRKMALIVRQEWKVPYISAYEDFCVPIGQDASHLRTLNISNCRFFAAPGVPIAFDSHHLTAAGSVTYASLTRARAQLP